MIKRNHSRNLPFYLFIFIFFATCSTVVAQRVENSIDVWRPLKYTVSITLDNQLSQITATTDIEAEILKKSVHQVDLQFGALSVDGIRFEGIPTTFSARNGQLSVSIPNGARLQDPVHITISYHGHPADGLMMTNDKDGKPSAVGDNWPDRVHNWIPCLDHPSAKAPVIFTITAPSRDFVIANGSLDWVKVDASGNMTWRYEEHSPIPPYCMVIAVGEFSTSPASGVPPITVAVPQSDADRALQFAPAPKMVQFFSERVSPYPYEKLALIVGATQFGGMENSSAIVFPSNFLVPRLTEPLTRAFQIPLQIETTTAHEIAHQWFGDSVTESTWSDLWLSEGFATYFAGLFIERYEGKEEFRSYMEQQAKTYLAYEKQRLAPIHDSETRDLMSLLNANNYQKGAWVLHMLRGLVGDEKFFSAIRNYYREHQGSIATTDDLRRAFERESGMNLSQFFDRWVFQAGHPKLEVAWKADEWTPKDRTLTVSIKQTQTSAPFQIPVTLLVRSANGEKRTRVVLNQRVTHTTIDLDSRPTQIIVDPDDFLLKEVSTVPQ
jgi:aminopeptidase N